VAAGEEIVAVAVAAAVGAAEALLISLARRQRSTSKASLKLSSNLGSGFKHGTQMDGKSRWLIEQIVGLCL